jgi:hypothetical protein
MGIPRTALFLLWYLEEEVRQKNPIIPPAGEVQDGAGVPD